MQSSTRYRLITRRCILHIDGTTGVIVTYGTTAVSHGLWLLGVLLAPTDNPPSRATEVRLGEADNA